MLLLLIEGGAVAQSLEGATPGEEVLDSVGSVSV